MKMMFLYPGRVMLAMGALAFVSISVTFAQDANGVSNSVSAPAATAAPVQPGADAMAPMPRLPYGAGDIVKLSRAHVSEDIILNYVRNSGTTYNLSAQDVLTLRNEGVSDQVIGAMLDQRTKVAVGQSPQPAQQQTPVVPAPDPNAGMTAPPADQGYATPAPASSTAYVIPYTPTAPYYGYYPYYYPYTYGGPVISFGFGFGGYGHGYYGHYGHGYYYGHGGWGHGGWGHGAHH